MYQDVRGSNPASCGLFVSLLSYSLAICIVVYPKTGPSRKCNYYVLTYERFSAVQPVVNQA